MADAAAVEDFFSFFAYDPSRPAPVLGSPPPFSHTSPDTTVANTVSSDAQPHTQKRSHDAVHDSSEAPPDDVTPKKSRTRERDCGPALDQEQQKAVSCALNGQPMFLTGAAGTGKSFTLMRIVDELEERGDTVVTTSSTGVSALLVGGCTVHSLLKLHPRALSENAPWKHAGFVRHLAKNGGAGLAHLELLEDMDVLIIDEISMISADLLSYAEYFFRCIRRTQTYFGGVKVIFVGDFYQLKPVGKNERYAFQSSAWRPDTQVCYLTRIHRQAGDQAYAQFLNRLRTGALSSSDIDRIRKTKRNVFALDGVLPTYLYSRKFNVETRNQQELEKLPADSSRVFVSALRITVGAVHKQKTPKAQRDVRTRAEAFVRKHTMATDKLELRIGAQVMLLVNTFMEDGLANGSRGVVEGFDDTSSADVGIIVRFAEAGVHTIYKHTFEYPDDKIRGWSASLSQYPLVLAWALTIHKSQGATLDRVVTSLGYRDIAFDPRMAYVASSRVRSFACVRIEEFAPSLCVPDPVVRKFMEPYERRRQTP